jgi:hypothetical protein
MVQKYLAHSTKVVAWTKVATPGLSSSELIDLFELAVSRLWARSCNTVGDVTLTVVADRALENSKREHTLLRPLTIDAKGIQWAEFRKSSAKLKPNELISAFSYFITEFIAIASSITGEILSMPLHVELATVTLKQKEDRENL